MDSSLNQVHRLTEKEIKLSLQSCGNTYIKDCLPDQKIRSAAVLVPLFIKEDEWHLLFTRRTDTLQFHKGQVSFPGGVTEHGDQSPKVTALRESCEEISLNPELVRVLGCLPTFTSLTNYQITPVVGRIQWPIDLIPNPNEVQRIFAIPLKWLIKTENREWRPFQAPDGRIDQVIFYLPYDGEVLWGITARITVTLLNALNFVE